MDVPRHTSTQPIGIGRFCQAEFAESGKFTLASPSILTQVAKLLTRLGWLRNNFEI